MFLFYTFLLPHYYRDILDKEDLGHLEDMNNMSLQSLPCHFHMDYYRFSPDTVNMHHFILLLLDLLLPDMQPVHLAYLNNR